MSYTVAVTKLIDDFLKSNKQKEKFGREEPVPYKFYPIFTLVLPCTHAPHRDKSKQVTMQRFFNGRRKRKKGGKR